jgi:predicted PurR-regulated permease PerM
MSDTVESSTPAPVADTDPACKPDPISGPLLSYSPFRLGLLAAFGFGIAYLLFRAVQHGEAALLLIAMSFFLAAGLDPAVRQLERWGLKRGPAVGVVFIGMLATLTGLGFAVVPPLVEQISHFAKHLPGYITKLQQNSRIAELDRRFGILQSTQDYLKNSQLVSDLADNLLTVTSTVVTAIFSVFTIAVLTLYFLAYLRDITGFAYRMTPASRRVEVTRIGDNVVTQIGRYFIGTIGLAFARGTATLAMLAILGVPYPFALAFIAALLDLAPIIGTAFGVIVVSTIVFLESVPAGIGIVIFFVCYEALARLVLIPRLLHPSVRIGPAAAVLGALAGYLTLGVVGFLFSIPLVAIITLIVREAVLPRQARR